MPKGIDSDNNTVVDYYMPDVLTVSDYEPFGAPLEDRTGSEISSYRYAYNGKEKVDDWNGNGNTYDFEARIYNPRIAKFLSCDPLEAKYPFLTTYQFAANSPIFNLDNNGKEITPYIHRDDNGNITMVEFVITGKIIVKDGINRNPKNVAEKVNGDIENTWTLKTSEAIPPEWQNADGSAITFKVTSKLEVADESQIQAQDHVVFVVTRFPELTQEDDSKVGGTTAAFVNQIGGKKMYYIWGNRDSGHESGHWLGNNHPRVYTDLVTNLGASAVKAVRAVFGSTNIMDHPEPNSRVVPEGVVAMQFFIAYKLHQQGLLNTGDNKYDMDEDYRKATRDPIPNLSREGLKIIDQVYKIVEQSKSK